MNYSLVANDPFYRGKSVNLHTKKLKQLAKLKNSPTLLEPTLSLIYKGVYHGFRYTRLTINLILVVIERELKALAYGGK